MPSNPYRSNRRKIDKRLKRGNEMNTANRTSLETLLHWMEVNESSPHYAMSSALLAMGKASHHTQILYHFKHDEKADDVLSELQKSLNKEFRDSLSYGEDEVVFFTGESVSAGLSARKESTYLKINCTGEKNIINEIVNFIQSTGRTKKQPIVSRITKSTYGFEETELTLPEVVKSPTKDFYPFLEKDASEMWEDFYKSSANVMLFIGQAGTGKTSMIRAMLESRGYENKVHLVDNEMVLLDPELMGYVQKDSEISLLITEDADRFVAKREDENASMVGLLNASSGLVGGRVKFIISTNLKNLSSVDEALIRPGRCHKVVQFRKLTPDEANAARQSIGLSSLDFTKDVTLAEALNEQNNTTGMMTKIGF